MEHLEIEFKMLLKENIFKKILSDYKNQNQRQLSTNQLLSFSSSIGKEKILTQN